MIKSAQYLPHGQTGRVALIRAEEVLEEKAENVLIQMWASEGEEVAGFCLTIMHVWGLWM